MTSLRVAAELHLDALLESGRAPATVRKARNSLEQFQRELRLGAAFPLAGVTREHVTHFLRRGRETQWASRTERRHFETLRQLFAFAVSAGLLEISPLVGMEAPSYVDRPPERALLTEADLATMLASCDRMRDRAIVWVMYCCGTWPAELVHLRVGDVDLERGAVQLAGKLAPLSRPGAAELERYLEARRRKRGEVLFPSRTGAPLTVGGIETLLGKLSRALGRPVNAGTFRVSLRARGGLWKRPRKGPDAFVNRPWPDCPLVRARDAFFAANEARGLSASTRETYERALGRFLAFYLPDHPDTGADKITAADVEGYLTYLGRRGLAIPTIHQMYRSMRRWLAFLEERGLIASNPMAKMRAPRLPHVVIRPYSEPDITALIQEASRQEDARDVALVTLLYGAGLRAGEVINLRVDEIMPGQLLVRQGKGSKDRLVPLDEHTEATLRRYAARNDGGRIFGSLQGISGLYQAIARLCDCAGVPKSRVIHRFRDTFAIRFLENGGHVDDLQVILGHSDIATTLRYVRHGRDQRAIDAGKRFLPWSSRNGHTNGNGPAAESPKAGGELALLEELERITRRKLELLEAGARMSHADGPREPAHA